MLGPAPGAEGTPKGDPALMPLGPEPCAQCLGQHVYTLHLFIHVTFFPQRTCYVFPQPRGLGVIRNKIWCRPNAQPSRLGMLRNKPQPSRLGMLRNKPQPPWLGMLRNKFRPLGWVCYVTSPAYLLKRECNGEIVGEIINHSLQNIAQILCFSL